MLATGGPRGSRTSGDPWSSLGGAVPVVVTITLQSENQPTATLPDFSLKIDDSAFQKYERMREKVEQAEAEAEALAELQGVDIASTSSRFDNTSTDDEIEAQLRALKQKKQGE